MRVLVTSTSQAGHFHPLVPFLKALAARGDELLLVVPPALEATARGMEHAFRLGAPPSPEVAAIWERVPSVPPGEAAVLVNREIFGRLCTAALLPAVEQACSDWRPDLVLREPCEYAGAVVAARAGIRQAQVAISQARVEASALDLVGPALEPHGPDLLETIRRAPYLTRFPASLDPSPFMDTRRCREETTSPQDPGPDWWNGRDAPLVYLTLGTVAAELPIAAAAYRAALAAVAPLAVRVLLTVGRNFDVSSLGAIPANVHVEPWVPQERVLADAAVVVCHGGSGTTFGALAAGVPLVMIPFFADQPGNARVIAGAGAGVVVEAAAGRANGIPILGSADVTRIRAAIESVLAGASYRENARRIAAEMACLPTIPELLGELTSS